jgi:hypothetical protein
MNCVRNLVCGVLLLAGAALDGDMVSVEVAKRWIKILNPRALLRGIGG